jgi:signal transduction histidine kinase
MTLANLARALAKKSLRTRNHSEPVEARMSDPTERGPDSGELNVLHFEVHPSVLFKLGEDLITDDAQALVELVKNSYDADARVVRIEIDTDKYFDAVSGAEMPIPKVAKEDEPLGGDTPEERARATGPADLDEVPDVVLGRLRVIDDGVGMTTSAIRNGWLTVSSSEKRALKARHGTTRRGRTPLGDKGLGRLGVQRLGRLVYLSSVPALPDAPEEELPGGDKVEPGGEEQYLGDVRNVALIDWDAFLDAKKLSSVPIHVTSVSVTPQKAGSMVEVRGLRDLNFWRAGADRVLERELMAILSPYDRAGGLTVQLRINGVLQDLRRNARELLAIAPINYRFDYLDGILTIAGGLSSSIVSARKAEDINPYETLIARDNGHAFAEWLVNSKPKRARELGVELGDDKYFIRLRTQKFLDQVTLELDAVDPGPFEGEASSIDYEDESESSFSSVTALRAFAKDMSGVRVYRDGFGIRLDKDWLKLGDQQTSGSSWYGLRTGNTTGYVNLTAANNPLLEETTSREAFRDTPAWQGFYSLMRAWTKYSQEAQSFVRRGYVEYRQKHAADLAQLSTSSTPQQIAENVTKRLDAAREVTSSSAVALEALDEIERSVDALRATRQESDSGVWTDPALNRAIDEATNSIVTARSRAASVVQQFEGLRAEYESMQGALELLKSQVDSVQEQIGLAWESVALGLSAEALTHEVEHITDGLIGRSVQIAQFLAENAEANARALTYANFVRSNAAQLAVQSARMNPSLRYRRERKKDFAVSGLTQKTVDYYSQQWEKRPVSVELLVLNDFTVRINEGKFGQVLDNLLINSEYWISRSIAQKRARAGKITITVDAPYLTVEDTGPGVDLAVAASLFEAFVTTKPGEDGRGLGLFIVRQLVESEGGRIDLSPVLNAEGRPFIFRLELQALIQS